MERRYRPHLLTAPEERIVTELSLTGRGAWGRLFDELTSSIRVELARRRASRSRSTSRSRGLFDPERERRRDGAEAVTAALEPGLRTRAYVFNTLLQDKATMDRLRSYPHWLATRNLSNEASDESVQALVEAVRNRNELARRWYRTKAKLLGIDRLADYDRMAVVGADDEQIGWDEGREIVLDDLRVGLAADERDRRAGSWTSAGSTSRRGRRSAAAHSAPPPSPPSTPTCCSTGPTGAAT